MRRGPGRSGWTALLGGTLGLLAALPALVGGQAAAKPGEFAQVVLPVVKKYCWGCHNSQAKTAGLALDKYLSLASMIADRDVWDRVSLRLRNGTMPPPGAPSPGDAQRQAVAKWIDTQLSASCEVQDPGRVTLRRLNRAEYQNTIRDLVGIDFDPTADFPSDDVGNGFDNQGDVLSMSTLLFEKYLQAAEKIAQAAIRVPSLATRRFEVEDLPEEEGSRNRDDGLRVMFTRSVATASYHATEGGAYRLSIRACAQQAGPELARMAILVDGVHAQTMDVAATPEKPALYELPLTLRAGAHQISVTFINDYYAPNHPDPKQRDRNLLLDYIEIAGPFNAVGALPASHTRIIFTTPAPGNEETAARQIISKFASRAYRRPATSDEVDRLLAIYRLRHKEKESFEKGIQLAVQAVLVSPHFLFRVESDGKPTAGQKARNLNDWEIASRLSYFLWSSMPDDELFALAAQGKLQSPTVLKAQAARMLKDPKARGLGENFAGQWLQLRRLQDVNPDRSLFPRFSPQLLADMEAETRKFFDGIVAADRSVLEFIDADYTYVNRRLADHYGIGGVTSDEFQRVPVKGTQRGGVITQASILALTSNPTRTSPVKRGKFILEEILGDPVPPPPPGTPDLKADGQPLTGRTLRERLEQHRKDPTCYSCHAKMDPLGFGLENFDAIGAYRAVDGGAPVDASGTLPNGKKFSGVTELKSLLKSRSDDFVRNLTAKLMTFALGRGLTSADACVLDDAVKAAKSNQYRFSSIVNSIITSDAFRKRRTGEATR